MHTGEDRWNASFPLWGTTGRREIVVIRPNKEREDMDNDVDGASFSKHFTWKILFWH